MDTIKASDKPILSNDTRPYSSLFNSFSKKQGAFFKAKLVYKQKFINKKLLKKFKFTGYLLYGLCSNEDDIPLAHITSYPKGELVMLGSALGYDKDKSEEAFNEIKTEIAKSRSVVILLNKNQLNSESNQLFEYPIRLDVPAFSFTNVYKKRRFSKKPRILTYIDGPFYANSSLPFEEQKKHLKAQVYECISERANLTDDEFKNLNDNLKTGRDKNDK